LALTPKFATPAEQITQSFSFVLEETDIPLELREAILPLWIYVHQNGNPKFDVSSLAVLGEFEWAWKPFEDWSAKFGEANRWPYMWQREELPDLIKRGSAWKLRQARVKIFAHTLTMSAFSCRDGVRRAPYLKKFGWRVSSIKCPVEDEVSAKKKDTVIIDDWRTWPPFFPGDRSHISGLPRRI
jgi:hypothetical protein